MKDAGIVFPKGLQGFSFVILTDVKKKKDSATKFICSDSLAKSHHFWLCLIWQLWQ